MTVATSSRSVSPAFLQEIKEDDQQLRDLIERAFFLLGSPARARIAPLDIVVHFERMRDQLAVHFALEDVYGYFEDEIAEAPRLTARANTLHAEHDELFIDMCRLIEQAERLLDERSNSVMIELAEDFIAFHTRLQQHESSENDLILQAFDDDIGVGD